MTRPCPRCGAPSVADQPVCQMCGASLVDAMPPAVEGTPPVEAAAPAAEAAAPAAEPVAAAALTGSLPPEPQQPWAAGVPVWGMPAASAPPVVGLPAACWRCQAPLYPGQPYCANCGFDYRPVGMAPVRKRNTKLMALGAIVAAGIIAVAGFVVVNRSSGWTPDPEPSPSGTWTKFTAPDGGWSINFPGSSTPQAMTMSMPMDGVNVPYTYHMVTAGGVVYEAGEGELPASQLVKPEAQLSSFEQGIKIWGTVLGSRTLTVGGLEAREFKFKYNSLPLEGVLRAWLSGNHLYMLMVAGSPGSTIYPEHFFETFTEN